MFPACLCVGARWSVVGARWSVLGGRCPVLGARWSVPRCGSGSALTGWNLPVFMDPECVALTLNTRTHTRTHALVRETQRYSASFNSLTRKSEKSVTHLRRWGRNPPEGPRVHTRTCVVWVMTTMMAVVVRSVRFWPN